MNIHVIGNCQAWPVANSLRLLFPFLNIHHSTNGIKSEEVLQTDTVFVQRTYLEQVSTTLPTGVRILEWPTISFSGFHPDMIGIPGLRSPTGFWHSSIILKGFVAGMNQSQVYSLFQPDVFDHLDFMGYFSSSCKSLEKNLSHAKYPSEKLLSRWIKSGCFMHGFHHPRLHVLIDVAIEMQNQLDISGNEIALREFSVDTMLFSSSWSVYPWVSDNLGLGAGAYLFKGVQEPGKSLGKTYDLERFIESSFIVYKAASKNQLSHPRLNLPCYQNLEIYTKSSSKVKNSPYIGLPNYQFWRRSLEKTKFSDVDPVISSKFTISRTDKIATAGSCFAQHIARTLSTSGFNYYVSETVNPKMSQTDATARQYGLFSARFGNIYTARQLVQLFDRAYGFYDPIEEPWLNQHNRWVDPFRPTVEPHGFESIFKLEADRNIHLSAVRQMFESLNVFIFTLGLTESWRSKSTGAVLPLAPGVNGGAFDSTKYEFVNFSVEDIKSDLNAAYSRLCSVNPSARMILTVSPVPLIATYENRHVLISNAYSKATLRTAVEEISLREKNIAYFPSYEIITGNHVGNNYFEKDLRTVKIEGVNHVMSLFLQHYTQSFDQNISSKNSIVSKSIADHSPVSMVSTKYSDIYLENNENDLNALIICDEEKLHE